MSYSLGDGIAVCALSFAFVGYWWIERRYRQRKLEVLHEERMKAMELGIPLFEVGEEREAERARDDGGVVPILGLVLFTFSVGAMIVLLLNLPPSQRSLWVAPIPVAFMGLGLVGYHLLLARPRI